MTTVTSQLPPLEQPELEPAATAECSRPTVDLTRLDLTRIATTAIAATAAVLVARQLARRPAPPIARVTMGPGGWVSMKGGAVAVRPARRPFGRPRPVTGVPPAATSTQRVPLWARVISAVPLQRLVA